MKKHKTKKMDDKYFVPDIEDLRVSYEMEFNNAVILPNDKNNTEDWKKVILKGVDSAVAEYLRLNWYRTPYLTKEQIEAEGWISHAIAKHVWYREDHKDNGILYLTKEDEFIIIEDDRDSVFLFRGECKSINEFRFICKLLKIDKE